MIGKKFGNRLLVAMVEPVVHFNNQTGKYNSHKRCLCRCICGKESIVRLSDILNGRCVGCSRCAKSCRKELRVGEKIGSWTVKRDLGLKRTASPSSGKQKGTFATAYLCECVCGFTKEIFKSRVANNNYDICKNCFNKKIRKVGKKIPGHVEISIGDSFGLWTVVDWVLLPSGKTSKGKFVCSCSCGKEKVLKGYRLRKLETTRCRECFMALVKQKKEDWDKQFRKVEQLRNKIDVCETEIKRLRKDGK